MAISDKATQFAGLPVIDYQPAVGLVLPTMPRRVFRSGDGKSIWAITLERDLVTIDSDSRKAKPRPSPTPELARDRYRKLIAEKVEEGYVERKAPETTLRDALVSALMANPDDAVARMAFADYLSEQGEQLPAVAYRVDYAGHDEEGSGTVARLQSFLAEAAVGLVQALVVGDCWGEEKSTMSNAEVVEALIGARERLTNLRALFLGDITHKEAELSWIVQGDLTALLAAFPRLEHFRSRGGSELGLSALEHPHLKSLIFEASNLPGEVARAVGASDLPALEHLELWLGAEEYGADTTPDDLDGILQGKHLPSLRYLGLRNSEIADDIPSALAGAPILERLRILDLSLGNLSDRGAEALLAIPGLARLEKLDIHHHYISPEWIERLQALGIQVDASDPQEAEDNGIVEPSRYCAHY
jgi:uncharacterized protein (TIGR02996 family)